MPQKGSGWLAVLAENRSQEVCFLREELLFESQLAMGYDHLKVA